MNEKLSTDTEWVGVWVSYNRYVFKPKQFRLDAMDDPSDFWYVPCGCGVHGDHLGCAKICRNLGCSHPLKISVACVKLTADGDEVDEVETLHIRAEDRPPKKKSCGDIREELLRLKEDLDRPTSPYRNLSDAERVCYHVSQRIEVILK